MENVSRSYFVWMVNRAKNRRAKILCKLSFSLDSIILIVYYPFFFETTQTIHSFTLSALRLSHPNAIVILVPLSFARHPNKFGGRFHRHNMAFSCSQSTFGNGIANCTRANSNENHIKCKSKYILTRSVDSCWFSVRHSHIMIINSIFSNFSGTEFRFMWIFFSLPRHFAGICAISTLWLLDSWIQLFIFVSIHIQHLHRVIQSRCVYLRGLFNVWLGEIMDGTVSVLFRFSEGCHSFVFHFIVSFELNLATWSQIFFGSNNRTRFIWKGHQSQSIPPMQLDSLETRSNHRTIRKHHLKHS